jgi:hypothetical protein
VPEQDDPPTVRNPAPDEERVSTAALVAAMELIRGMSGNPAATRASSWSTRFGRRRSAPRSSPGRSRFSSTGFSRCSTTHHDRRLSGRRLRRLELVPEVMVTRMHGTMGAAAVGKSPLRWREQFGPLVPAEALA